MTDTYGDLKTKIANEIARSDLTSEIATAIQDAIAKHQRERFYFNEVAEQTFNTVASQKWYDDSDLADIPNILDFDFVKVTVSATTYALIRRSHAELEHWDSADAVHGDPTDYAYYRQQIRLFPTPNAIRVVSLSYLKRLTALSLDADTNAWTKREDAEALIRHTAKADLFFNLIRNFEKGARSEQDEARCLSYLRSETTQRIATGRLVATDF